MRSFMCYILQQSLTLHVNLPILKRCDKLCALETSVHVTAQNHALKGTGVLINAACCKTTLGPP